MSSPVYQYMINIVVSIPIRRCPGVFMNVPVREDRALDKEIFWCGKFYYPNTIIIKYLDVYSDSQLSV